MQEGQRIQKIIANAGFCSRRKAEEFIIEGRVTINGLPAKIGMNALDTDEIRVNNTLIQRTGRMIYLMLNKPAGHTTTLADPFEKKTIAKLIPVQERVFPIGRLDKNSRGLIILTNDGDLAQRLTHPRYGVQKTYLARLDKPYDTVYTEKLQKGITLRDGPVRANVVKIEKDLVQVTMSEGRKHLVKRMLRKCGYTVRDLVRVRIGSLKLDVKAGKTRPLTKDEVEMLKQTGSQTSNQSVMPKTK